MLRCARVLVTSPSISARIFQPFSLSTRYRHNKAGKGDRKNPKKPWWVQSKEATNSVDPVVLEAEVREKLQSEQRAVLDLVLAGHNVFITGNPGTGKSFLLRQLVNLLTQQRGKEAVGVCAATGVAGIHISGSTVHSFLGCGKAETEQDWIRAEKNEKVRKRLCSLEVLLLDEVSMLSSDFLDRASRLVSSVKQVDQPFGGVQVLLSGDFLQLPPVQAAAMAFESPTWQELKLQHVTLQQNFRHMDEKLQSLLQQLRNGTLPLSSLRSAATPTSPSAAAPMIVSTNAEAHSENQRRLDELPGEVRVFKAKDWTEKSKTEGMKKAFESLCTEKVLQLKVGSSVMLLINKRSPNKCRTQAERPFSLPSLNPMMVMPDTFRETPLVNGSIGVVVAFEKSEDDADAVEYPVVEFAGRERVLITPFVQSGEFGHHGQYERRQVPLKLAWALTIHKTQGLTLDAGDLKLNKIFEPAQLYVALSRFRSLESVSISSLPSRLPRVTPARQRAMAFHETIGPGQRSTSTVSDT